MSLLPFLFDSSYLRRPTKILDQHFGLALDPDDILEPLSVPRWLMRGPAGYLRNWKSLASEVDSGSTLTCDGSKFQANLDVQQFKPDEISVKITGDKTVTIEGKHEEKEDEHGQVYRHFIRRYTLPKDCDMSRIESKLSSDGILTICAPKVNEDQLEYKNIPITQTGEPAKQTQKKRKIHKRTLSNKFETRRRCK